MEGFPRDIQTMILNMICGKDLSLLLPLVKINKMFHTLTVRYVIDHFNENTLIAYLQRCFPDLAGTEVQEWGVCLALREEWNNQPSLLASFFLFVYVENMAWHTRQTRKLSLRYDIVSQLFWNNNLVLKNLVEKNRLVHALWMKRNQVDSYFHKIRDHETQLTSLLSGKDKLESERNLLEEQLEELEAKMKKKKS